MNPLDEFHLTDAGLGFTNLSERYGYAEPGATYDVTWSMYDNLEDATEPLSAAQPTAEPVLPLPDHPRVSPDQDRYLVAEIRSRHSQQPAWRTPVRVYLRPAGDTFEVVGIERESEPLPPMR